MDLEKIRALSKNAKDMRELRSTIQNEYKEENTLETFSRNQCLKLLEHARKKVSETKLDSVMSKMENDGYVFPRRGGSKKSPYSLSFQNVYDIANCLGVKPHSSKGFKAFVAIMMNLKGGVGKTLATNMASNACIVLDEFLLKGLRVLIIDLDPQSTTTESNLPNLKMGDADVTSIQAMAEDFSREDLLEYAVKSTALPNLDIIPCGTFDGFITEQLTQDDIRGEHKSYDLLRKRIIEPLENDYDIIFCDVGPHMDIVLRCCLATANGIFIPVPPTFYNFDSSLRFIEKLHETIGDMEKDGLKLERLKFIKGFVTKDVSHLNTKNSKHNTVLISTLEEDLKEVFGRNDVLPHPLRQEDAYERSVELGATIFTLNKGRYEGSASAFNRSLKHANSWGKEVVQTMLDFQKDL